MKNESTRFKSLPGLMTALLICLSAAPVLAQNTGQAIYPGREAELDNEKAAMEKCLSATSTPGEAADCTQWIALSTCAMNYGDGLPKIEKFLSTKNLQTYRIEARKQLPKYCNPMAAVRLDLEILDKDKEFDAGARMKRWLQIVATVPKLTPEQHLIVAREMAQSPEFPSLVKNKKAKSFFVSVCDEIYNLLPETSSDGATFLHELENAAPDLIDARAHAVLMLDELAGQQYVSAQGRFKHIDFGVLSKKASDQLLKSIFQAAVPLFGNRSFDDAVCFPEFPVEPISKMEQARFDALKNPSSEAAMTVLRYEASVRFAHCEFDGVLEQFADIWNVQYRQTDAREFAKDLVVYIEKSFNSALLRSAIRVISTRVKGDARKAFIHEYGDALMGITSVWASAALDNASLRPAACAILEDAMAIASPAQAEVMTLLHGRIDARQKKYVEARQYWSRLIENKNTSASIRAQAYYLSIRALKAEKKNKEADALIVQFKELMPSHPLHAEF